MLIWAKVISFVLTYWKELLGVLVVFSIIFYVWNLDRKYHNALDTIEDNKQEFQKERDKSLESARKKEQEYKDLEHKYTIEVLKQKLIIKETIIREIKTIKGEDNNHTIFLDANCSKCFKENYNETNIINRSI
jgi:hypothetical protein